MSTNLLFRLKGQEEIAKLMVSELPEELFTNPNTTFCDPAMGGGQYLQAIINRCKLYYNIEDILPRIYGAESSVIHLNWVKRNTELGGSNLTKNHEDFNGMKFDVVIGNPPYQGGSESKRWVLWHKFLENAVSQSDRVSYVIPSSITSPGKMWNMIRENLVKIDFTVSDHFRGVGSTFCRVVIDKNFSGDTEIVTDEGTMMLDVSGYDFLPPVVNSHNMSLYSRFSNTRTWKVSTEYHTSKKSDWVDEDGEIEVWHTNAQTFKTSKVHPNNSKIRVGVTLSGYPEFKVMHNMGGSQIIVWTECATLDEAQELADYLNGPEIQEVMSVFKWSGWNKLEVIKLLGK